MNQSVLIKYENRLIFYYFLLCIFIFYAPIVVLITLGFIARNSLNNRIGKITLSIVLTFFLLLTNFTKKIEGDWVSYYNFYKEITDIGLIEFLVQGGSSIRITEPIYYLISLFVSKLSNGNVYLLITVITSIIYITYIYTIEKLLTSYSINRWLAVVCVSFAVLAGITFTLTLHLVRQYIAGTILFLYFVFLIEGKYRKAVIMFIVGSLLHNSFVVPASLLICCIYLFNSRWFNVHYLITTVMLIITGYLIGYIFENIVGSTAFKISALIDDGSLSIQVIALDLILYLASISGVVYFKNKNGFNAKCSKITVFFLSLFGGLLIGFNELPLFLLRFYFYIEWFRIIGIITIIWFIAYRYKIPSLALLIVPFSFLILELRLINSPLAFGGGAFEHFTGSVSWWIDKIGVIKY
jgi:hypothetical protein